MAACAPPQPIWRGPEHSRELLGVSARSDGAVVVFATSGEVLRYDEHLDPRFFPRGLSAQRSIVGARQLIA